MDFGVCVNTIGFPKYSQIYTTFLISADECPVCCGGSVSGAFL